MYVFHLKKSLGYYMLKYAKVIKSEDENCIYSFHIGEYDNQMEKGDSLDSSLELGLIPATLVLKVSQIILNALQNSALVMEQSVQVNPFKHRTVFQHKDFKLQTV